MSTSRTIACIGACVGALFSTGCGDAEGPGGVSGAAAVLEPCARGEGRCGQLSVMLAPAQPELGNIELNIRVLPARAEPPAADPIYLLAGGPGQAATEVGPLLRPVLHALRAEREIVLVDQRGTGSSAPLDCELPRSSLNDLFTAEFPTEILKACVSSYAHSPKFFVTERAVEDLESVRAHLGHPKINLFGLSYGTRLGLSYMRRHADRVRTAVLDGVAPPTEALPVQMDAGMRHALEATLARCAQDPRCERNFPKLGPRLLTWVETLDHEPWVGSVEHPRTGETQAVTLDADAVTGILRSALYAPIVASLLPLALDAAIEGNPRPLIALSAASEGTADTMSLGLFLSVVCSEDMREIEAGRAELPSGEPEGTSIASPIFRGRMLGPLRDACALWPRGEVPSDHARAVDADTPTLLLSGALDPATPVAWASKAAKNLPNSTHIVVPAAGHGTWASPCVADLIASFVNEGGAAGLDRGCVESNVAPPFFHSAAGPHQGSAP